MQKSRHPYLLYLVIALAVSFTAVLVLFPRGDNLPPPSSSGEALIGGPFTMTDHHGRPVTEKDLLGHNSLLFFGYTYCPDICPTELQVMTVALNDLGSTGSDIVPYFVTVDPGRDTPEALSAYVANFHPRLVGLTGTPAEVAEMAKAYRVYYARVENQSSPADYLMDHSSIIYLMGPDGKFLKHFTYTSDAKALAAGLKEALGR